jgi:steroid delta-isomerase-like uncharacterized protein
MSAKMNKVVARRYFEEFLNRGNLSVADDISSSDVVYRGPLGVTLHGIDRLKRFFLMVRRAFPDLNYVAEEGIAEGNTVVSCFTMRGTFETEYQGLPGSGKPVSIVGVDIFRVTNGKIKEVQTFCDTYGQMQQLGLIPYLKKAEGG